MVEQPAWRPTRGLRESRIRQGTRVERGEIGEVRAAGAGVGLWWPWRRSASEAADGCGAPVPLEKVLTSRFDLGRLTSGLRLWRWALSLLLSPQHQKKKGGGEAAGRFRHGVFLASRAVIAQTLPIIHLRVAPQGCRGAPSPQPLYLPIREAGGSSSMMPGLAARCWRTVVSRSARNLQAQISIQNDGWLAAGTPAAGGRGGAGGCPGFKRAGSFERRGPVACGAQPRRLPQGWGCAPGTVHPLAARLPCQAPASTHVESKKLAYASGPSRCAASTQCRR